MLEREKLTAEIKKRLRNNLPKVIFYLSLFYLIFLLFGVKYGFVASVTGAAFDSNFEKGFSPGRICLLAIGQLFVCFLAAVASLHIVLRIGLNAVFPFIWTGLHSSPFNAKGYYVGMITFIFIQLIPITPENIPTLMSAMLFADSILVLVLLHYTKIRAKKPDFTVVREGLLLVSRILKQDAVQSQDYEKVLSIENTLYQMAYDGHNFLHISRRKENVYYTFALMFQRAAYYFSDSGHTFLRKNPAAEEKCLRLSQFMERASANIHKTDNQALIEETVSLLEQAKDFDSRFDIFYRNFLQLMILALKEITGKSSVQKRLSFRQCLDEFFHHLELNGFELRFALRLSLVSALSFTMMHLLNSEHSYWIALNAFVITQPMYEDSVVRMRSRLIGSVIGCIMAYTAYALFPNTVGLYIYYTIMISCMYFSTPGKWAQPLFATTCGVSLASITLGGSAAVEYRLFYLLLAVIMVFVINRFIFPSTQQKKFQFYIRELYQMQKYYMKEMELGLRQETDLTELRYALINFHMLYQDVINFIDKNCPPELLEPYRQLLLHLWRMVAEAEQMIVLIQTESLPSEEKAEIAGFIKKTYSVFEQKQPILNSSNLLPQIHSVPIFSVLAERYYNNLCAVIKDMDSIPSLFARSYGNAY